MRTLPVDSIMVDMSHYDQANNLEKTRILAKECHQHGIAVEAESGRINGGEDGIADTGNLEGKFQSMDGMVGNCIVVCNADPIKRSTLHHPL